MINSATHIYRSELEHYESRIHELERNLVSARHNLHEAQKGVAYEQGKVDLLMQQIESIRRFSIGDKQVVEDVR